MIEVEFKFLVDDLDSVRTKLVELGGSKVKSVQQSDEYLNDPLRDFAKSDKALRIRQDGDNWYLTFKGPNLDPTAKIRREIETQLVDRQAAEQIRESFLLMEFYSVAMVKKQREFWSLERDEYQIEVCLDNVEEVGAFCELELVVQTQSEVEGAKTVLAQLAESLELNESTRTSYLAMLLKERGQL